MPILSTNREYNKYDSSQLDSIVASIYEYLGFFAYFFGISEKNWLCAPWPLPKSPGQSGPELKKNVFNLKSGKLVLISSLPTTFK